MSKEKANNKNSSFGGVFRSEEMVLCHIYLQPTVLYDVNCELGNLGIVELHDLNTNINAFQRTFVDEVRRIEEIERVTAFLDDQIQKESSIKLENPAIEPNVPRYREIHRLEANIEELEHNLRDINAHIAELRVKQQEFTEMNQVLLKTHRMVEFTRRDTRAMSMASEMLASSIGGSVSRHDSSRSQRRTAAAAAAAASAESGNNQMNVITGVIRAEKANSFHTMIWRICGRNALLQFFDIETPIDDVETEELVTKKVFLIITQGDHLRQKLRKICEGFRATIYRVPNDAARFRDMSEHVENDIRDIAVVIEQTLKQKLRMLSALAAADNLQTWKVQVAKLKAVFATMNLYRKTEKGFIGEAWCAQSDFGRLQAAIECAASKSGVAGQAAVEIVPTSRTRPTYYRLNKFTRGFQGIVDSYGIARYGEMNPAPYTVISFPFLFAVMFADAGHGFIMLLFALWMVLCERRLSGASNNEIWLTFFDGRYIILLMGMFSIYTGCIYNDVFAKAVNIFGSAFVPPEPHHYAPSNGTIANLTAYRDTGVYLEKATDYVYPIGIDPVWQLSENKIIFLNSFKMKLSVILGVMQMLFGVILSLFNHINFRNYVSVVFEFLPQLVFLLALFGYLITLIFMKWLTVWNSPDAPSILIDFINMFLQKYPTGPNEPKYLQPWFPHKQTIQTALLAAALLSVPVMLFVKPIILTCRKRSSAKRPAEQSSVELRDTNNRRQPQQPQQHPNPEQQIAETEQTEPNGNLAQTRKESTISTASTTTTTTITTTAAARNSVAIELEISSFSADEHGSASSHDESTGDLFIHQAIHTIEYCLGSISHTASYLRLWALSLAHSQLSEVLWNMVMRIGLTLAFPSYIAAIGLYIVFAIWAVLTVAILILMEGLSAFLHAIRLHWVEFQSKFYLGDGYAFQPFSFKEILAVKPE